MMPSDSAVSPAQARPRVFLRAEWRYLAMLNYAIDPKILGPFTPAGTELDFFEGATFVSLVGFRFLHTRVFGVAFPFHGDFDEINLRFYVKRRTEEGWRRGVVFIREFVPRRAIAYVARLFYGEPYRTARMRHDVKHVEAGVSVRYDWKAAGRWNSLAATGTGEPQAISAGSAEEFITEHYWVYTKRGEGSTEYQVEHPCWRIWTASRRSLDCDVAAVYGLQFAGALASPAASAFIADGSPVTVRAGRPSGEDAFLTSLPQ
jgi:uncharacterized protein YqjF (DUF2071 family)